MLVKLHKKDNRVVAAVCDKEIFGKKFEEGELQIDLSSSFYAGRESDEVNAGDVMRNADMINVVGEKSVNCAISEGLIDRCQVKKIAGIPYAQAVLRD